MFRLRMVLGNTASESFAYDSMFIYTIGRQTRMDTEQCNRSFGPGIWADRNLIPYAKLGNRLDYMSFKLNHSWVIVSEIRALFQSAQGPG